MKYAVLPQLPLELAIIEWCSTESQTEAGTSFVVEDAEVSVSSLRKQVGQ